MSDHPRRARNAPAPLANANLEFELEVDVRPVLDVLCGRWTSAILQTLERGTLRSNELARVLAGSPCQALTPSLRRLELLGLVERRIFAEVPARVEYSLTPLGHAFAEPVRALGEWARAHPNELQAVLDAAPRPGASSE